MSESRTNQEWLDALNASGELQEAALADLRSLLLRASLYFFNRNPGDFEGLNQEEILQLAEDSAQEALISLLDHLTDFRGESKFSTWAYKFAINKALMSARHERMKGVSLDKIASSGEDAYPDWLLQDKSDGIMPEQSSMRHEIRGIIRDVLENELTGKQRQVLSMMVFNDVPMDEVVSHLGVNRNAVYKMLHDARRKLKNGLQTRGFEVGEIIAWFGTNG